MAIRSKIGDIFLIPLQNDFAVGQIIDKHESALYVFVFDIRRSKEDNSPIDVADAEPIFAMIAMDALLYHGRWPIVANSKDGLKHRLRPTYKVGFFPTCYVESFEGKRLRLATREEENKLRFRTIYAPIRVDKAVKAYFGIGEWELDYEDLKYDYVRESSALA